MALVKMKPYHSFISCFCFIINILISSDAYSSSLSEPLIANPPEVTSDHPLQDIADILDHSFVKKEPQTKNHYYAHDRDEGFDFYAYLGSSDASSQHWVRGDYEAQPLDPVVHISIKFDFYADGEMWTTFTLFVENFRLELKNIKLFAFDPETRDELKKTFIRATDHGPGFEFCSYYLMTKKPKYFAPKKTIRYSDTFKVTKDFKDFLASPGADDSLKPSSPFYALSKNIDLYTLIQNKLAKDLKPSAKHGTLVHAVFLPDATIPGDEIKMTMFRSKRDEIMSLILYFVQAVEYLGFKAKPPLNVPHHSMSFTHHRSAFEDFLHGSPR